MNHKFLIVLPIPSLLNPFLFVVILPNSQHEHVFSVDRSPLAKFDQLEWIHLSQAQAHNQQPWPRFRRGPIVADLDDG